MKVWAYVAIAAMLAGAIGYGVHIVRKANRVDVAEARAEAAEQGRAADTAEIIKRLDDDAKQRGELLTRLGGIEERFNSLKIPEPGKLVLTKEIPGACPVSSVSPDFISVFNDASQPGIASP